jgi:hypothetical protein
MMDRCEVRRNAGGKIRISERMVRTMKLAEGLIERADLQKQIAQLEDRMETNVKVQEGEEPAEAVDDLIAKYEALMSRLENLIVRINKTNSATPFDDGTVAEAITRRDCMKSKIRAYRSLYGRAAITETRYSKNEIRFVRCVDAAALQRKTDSLSKSYRELDTKIQGHNWTVELLD